MVCWSIDGGGGCEDEGDGRAWSLVGSCVGGLSVRSVLSGWASPTTWRLEIEDRARLVCRSYPDL